MSSARRINRLSDQRSHGMNAAGKTIDLHGALGSFTGQETPGYPSLISIGWDDMVLFAMDWGTSAVEGRRTLT